MLGVVENELLLRVGGVYARKVGEKQVELALC